MIFLASDDASKCRTKLRPKEPVPPVIKIVLFSIELFKLFKSFDYFFYWSKGWLGSQDIDLFFKQVVGQMHG